MFFVNIDFVMFQELMTLLLPVWYTTDKISSDDVKDTKESVRYGRERTLRR
jgi:hypothetical protein